MARRPVQADEFPHVARAEAWARAVVAGRVPNCEWVRLACRRHLDDLKRSRTKDFAYRLDARLASKACRFIELQPLTKGRWAAKSTLFRLEDWQCFLTVCLFGWVRKEPTEDGRIVRRFRRAFLLIPRKNGKSEWAAAVGNYMLLADGEFGAEVYSGATTEKQAWFVFGAARQMAIRSPRLTSAFSLTVNASNLHVLGRNAKFEPIIGKPGDGANPHCAIHDEYHEHETDDQVDAMLTGMGAREQPLQIIITTAGDNVAGPCYQAQIEAQKMLSGVSPNESLFAVIFGIDAGDDWTSDLALRKANPNLGVSVSLEFLKEQRAIAIGQPRKAGRFKTKHLNVWVQAREAYYPIQRWIESTDGALRLQDYKGRPCWIGLDLASKVDICSLVLVFPDGKDEKGRPLYAVFSRHYLPEETVEQPENEHYQGWALELGHNGGPEWTDEERSEFAWPERPLLSVTEGGMVDYDRIKDDVLILNSAFQIEVLAYDPHQATHLITQLMKEGVVCLEFRPTVLNFSEPMKETEAVMRDRRIAHDGNPIMTWMISNVVAKEDAKENVYPRKQTVENKIDGAVALISAFGAMTLTPETEESVYQTRGVVEIEMDLQI